jgi:hypothetical protein
VTAASYAAVPHIVGYAAALPSLARIAHILFVAEVEGHRIVREHQPSVPDDLAEEYFRAIALAKALAIETAQSVETTADMKVILGCVAILSGHHKLGKSIAQLGEDGRCPLCSGDFYDQMIG